MNYFLGVLAAGMILGAPALAAGSAADGAAAVNPASSSEALPSGGAAPAQYESPPERSLGIACPPGPIMGMEDPSVEDSAGFRAGAGHYQQVIDDWGITGL
jgi:hypothetical protein